MSLDALPASTLVPPRRLTTRPRRGRVASPALPDREGLPASRPLTAVEPPDAISQRALEQGRMLLARLRLQPGQRVLDLGCGSGELSVAAAERIAPGGEVVGLDGHPLRVELANRRHPLVVARLGVAEDLGDWPSDSFDAVLLSQGLHALQNPARALSEILRVLRRGGRLAIADRDPLQPDDRDELVDAALAALAREREGAWRAPPPPSLPGSAEPAPAALASLLRNAGFDDVHAGPETFVELVRDVDELLGVQRLDARRHDLPPGHRALLRDRLVPLLEARRSEGVIALRRHRVFADARRPV